jgi:DNA-binding beta-propeller fold protein YncE
MSSSRGSGGLLCAVAACLHVAACGGDGSGTSSAPPPPSSPQVAPAPLLPAWQVPPPISPAQTAPAPALRSDLDGNATDISLPHNALVYDNSRNLFYASIPAAMPDVGNRIAIIDPTALTLGFSDVIGSEPNVLAIAADGSALYVGLDGSGELIRLALPAMTEQGRVTLVSHPIFGQSTAQDIAVSPTDPLVAAVTMGWYGQSPTVVLLRDMIVQPKRLELLGEGSDRIAFDSNGTTLYGLKLAFGSNDLSRMQVLADGLTEHSYVTFAAKGTGSLSFANGRVMAGTALYNAADLTAAGVVLGATYCRPRRSGPQLLCLRLFFSDQHGMLVLSNSETFVLEDFLVVALTEGSPLDVVEGPDGMVALRYPGGIRLFSSDRLTSAPPPPEVAWPTASFASSEWQIIDIGVTYNGLVYDSLRNRYYASIPGYVRGVSNSIATIEPASGKVTHSGPVGSEPHALAISADANWLYVALDGSGEVLRLALPSMSVQGRVRLPRDPVFFNQLGVRALAVSPADGGVVAVSLGRLTALGLPNIFSPSPGVVLLRDMVIQPKRVDTTNDLIAFDSAGGTLYGLNNSTSERGLRRLRVLADGLAEESAATTPDIYTRALGFTNNRVVTGAALRDAATLAQIGAIVGARDCWPQRSGSKLLCFGDSSAAARIIDADSDTLVAEKPIVYASTGGDFPTSMVQGPANQVAISYPKPHEFPMIRLFSSPPLP